MLIITRRPGERIMLGEDVVVEVIEVSGSSVRIGIAAPRSLPVYREEIWSAVKDENAAAAASQPAQVPDRLPVTNPWRFYGDYVVDLSDDEAERIGVDDPAETSVYVTVRAAEALEDFSANLRAPILIADGRGHQVINQADDAPIQAPLFAGLATEAA